MQITFSWTKSQCTEPIFWWNQKSRRIQRIRCPKTHFSETRSQAGFRYKQTYVVSNYDSCGSLKWITNCTLKSISAQSKRFNNCFPLLDHMFKYSAHGLDACWFDVLAFSLWRTSSTQWPWICTARCIFATTQFSQRYSWNVSKENFFFFSFSPMWTGTKMLIRSQGTLSTPGSCLVQGKLKNIQ